MMGLRSRDSQQIAHGHTASKYQRKTMNLTHPEWANQCLNVLCPAHCPDHQGSPGMVALRAARPVAGPRRTS